jgi:exosortase/archaeosortase family protein
VAHDAWQQPPTRRARIGVIVVAAALVLLWIGLHVRTLTATQNGWIRFGLTAFFSLLILLRPARAPAPRGLDDCVLPAVFCGVLLSLTGLLFGVRQFEWLGLLLLLFGCLQWGLPPRHAAQVWRAMFLLYWAHPLPSRFFGWLQLRAQEGSVAGAEWLLHILNVRVWADGMVLRTGFNTYEVPAWCSGMRTATTAFLVGLGLGLVKRLRAWEIAVVILLATLQALALNILRISTMVFVARARPETATEFLHDSTGVIVLGAVFLVYIEIAFWERRRRAAAVRRPDPHAQRVQRALTTHPPFWWTLFRHKWLLLAGLAGLLVLAGLVYKSRPFHRAEMVKDVALSLQAAGRFDDAQRAADAVLRRVPGDDAWRLEFIRILLVRERYTDVLDALERVAESSAERAVEKRILRAYSLMGLQRMDEAAAVVDALPEDARDGDPRVAMILAEMGVYAKNPDQAARYAVAATAWGPNAPRIRRLYPYLRTYKQWRAIIASDSRVAYRRPVEALCVSEAYMNLNDTSGVARVLERALAQWPDDPRLIEPLFFMALKRGPGKWDALFAAQVRRCLPLVGDADALVNWFPRCFGLARPDLAWAVYRRMRALDPGHPGLALAVTRFGHRWFVFRRAVLGLPAEFPDATLSLAPFYRIGLQLPAWHAVCASVPEGRLAVADPEPVRRAALQDALAAFRRRDAEGTLTRAMQYAFVRALDMAGDAEGARQRLALLDTLYPEQRERHRVLLSEIDKRQADWPRVYETLRGYPDADVPDLAPLIRLCEAQLRLDMGLAAVETARAAARLYPQFAQPTAYLAAALMEHDSFAEALHVLSRPRVREDADLDLLEAECLFRTQRYREWEAFCERKRLRRPDVDPNAEQAIVLPPAELATLWHWVHLPSEHDFDAAAAALRRNLADTPVRFIAAMGPLWLALHAREDGADALGRWLACGRDRTERALAANQLTLLLCRQGRFSEARRAAEQAVRQLPSNPTLWRILIGLSGGAREVVTDARRACPADSSIWLADLVTAEAPDVEHVAGAAETATPEALTRAAEYLYRQGRIEAAGAAARAALRVPPLFYKTLVDLKIGEDDIDVELITALKALRAAEPDNPLWAEMLGFVRFKRGGWEYVDSLAQMTAALENGATNPLPHLVAAEASRLLGNFDRAVDLLQRGRARNPDNVPLLNNLVYTLAQQPGGSGAALALTPLLIESGGDDPAVWDTVAHAYVSAGAYDEAATVLDRIYAEQGEGTRPWFRARILDARIALARGDAERAGRILDAILLRTRGIPDEDLMTANRLRAAAGAARPVLTP